MAVFIVIVHSSELYRKMDAANALKVLTLVLMLRCRDLYVCLYFCILSMVIPFHLQATYVRNDVVDFDNDSEVEQYKNACKSWILKTGFVIAYIDNGLTELDKELIDFAEKNDVKVLMQQLHNYQPSHDKAPPNMRRLVNHLMNPKNV